MSKSQIWSLELSITIAMFLIALVLFGAIILKHVPESETLLGDAENVMSFLTSGSEQSFLAKGVLNKSDLAIFSYKTLKRNSNIHSRVCIYFEDKAGRIINVDGLSGFGDSNISINNVPCRTLGINAPLEDSYYCISNSSCTFISSCPIGHTCYNLESSCLTNAVTDCLSTLVNGLCGSANGVYYPNVPSSNFCNQGTNTSVTGLGPWSWTCQGLNGGTNENCVTADMYYYCDSSSSCTFSSTCVSPPCYINNEATCIVNAPTDCPAPINGVCGSAYNSYYSSAPSSNLCSVGSPSAVSGRSGGGYWDWTCQGQFGGIDASCRTNDVIYYCDSSSSCLASSSCPGGTCYTNNYNSCITNAPVNCPDAQCGTAATTTYCSSSAPSGSVLCNLGSASAVSGAGPWSWTCTLGPSVVPCSTSGNCYSCNTASSCISTSGYCPIGKTCYTTLTTCNSNAATNCGFVLNSVSGNTNGLQACAAQGRNCNYVSSPGGYTCADAFYSDIGTVVCDVIIIGTGASWSSRAQTGIAACAAIGRTCISNFLHQYPDPLTYGGSIPCYQYSYYSYPGAAICDSSSGTGKGIIWTNNFQSGQTACINAYGTTCVNSHQAYKNVITYSPPPIEYDGGCFNSFLHGSAMCN